jgi:hypothetical protein
MIPSMHTYRTTLTVVGLKPMTPANSAATTRTKIMSNGTSSGPDTADHNTASQLMAILLLFAGF